MAKRDYYEVLGVSKTASKDEIKKAYRRLAVANHPDKNPGDKQAEALFREATEAYDVLSNDDKRQNYDQFGFAGVQAEGGTSGFDFSHIFREFDDLFGGFSNIFSQFGGSRRRSSEQGESLQYETLIDFQTAIFGGSVEVQYTRKICCDTCHGSGSAPGHDKAVCAHCGGSGQIRQSSGFFSINAACPQCRGSGFVISHPCKSCRGAGRKEKVQTLRVKIPIGIDDGQVVRIRDQGNEAGHRSEPGDLLIIVRVRAHKYYLRRGSDLYCVFPVTVTQAVLGAEVFLQSLDNKKIKIKIPSGIQHGKVLRIRGEGVPISAGRRGDLYVTLHIQLPKRINKEAEKLWKELAQTMSANTAPDLIAISDLE